MSHVTVVGFVDEESDAGFVRQLSDATLASLLSLHAAPEKNEQSPIVKVCRLKSPRQQFGAKSKDYVAVYCLNAAAVAMCEDLDITLTIIGEMDDMPDEVSYDLEAHYLPKEVRTEAE